MFWYGFGFVFTIEGQYSEQDRRGGEGEAPKVATRVGGFLLWFGERPL